MNLGSQYLKFMNLGSRTGSKLIVRFSRVPNIRILCLAFLNVVNNVIKYEMNKISGP